LVVSDTLAAFSAERLAAASATRASRLLWKDFDLVYGSPEATADGGWRASSEGLCLIVSKPATADNSITFDYMLENRDADSHVSAVVGYRGRGGDADMTAVLLETTGDTAALGLWVHKHGTWGRVPEVRIDRLPLSGRMRAKRRANSVTVFIDEKLVFEIGLEHARSFDGMLGIRWIAATVRPVADGNR
jgi:hypothetical protein